MMSDISEISKCFTLQPLKLSPKQLVLDPNNPRLNARMGSQRHYSDEELVSERVQSDIVRSISSSEHKVQDLVNSIKTQGFLSGTGAFIVERVEGTDRYLVLEGNRRTTAIKSLLQQKGDIPSVVAKSLEVIPVNEFRYKQGSPIAKEDVIDIYLGTIHISGQLEWGALEKALYIYRSYVRDYESNFFGAVFRLEEESVGRLALKFSTTKASIRKSIWVSRVYSQLVEGGYPIDAKKFTLLELCISDRRLRKEFFGMSQSCEFSEEGLEKFNDLMLVDEPPIRNPDHFKMFRFVERNGEPREVNAIVSSSGSIEQIYASILEEKNERKILEQLEDIRNRLLSLNISGFAADQNEQSVLNQINDIVENKLLVLVEDFDPGGRDGDIELDDFELPQSVSELISLKAAQMMEIIKDAMKLFPNKSCVKASLASKVLKHMGLVTRASRRQVAVEFIDETLEMMIRTGMVGEYKAKNMRVELLVD